MITFGGVIGMLIVLCIVFTYQERGFKVKEMTSQQLGGAFFAAMVGWVVGGVVFLLFFS